MLESADYGMLALICSVVHSACHIARAALKSDPSWLLRNTMNRSGMAALLLVLVATLPMSVGFVKEKVCGVMVKLPFLFDAAVLLPCSLSFSRCAPVHGARIKSLCNVLFASPNPRADANSGSAVSSFSPRGGVKSCS